MTSRIDPEDVCDGELLAKAKELLACSTRRDWSAEFFARKLEISLLRAQDLVAKLQEAGVEGTGPALPNPADPVPDEDPAAAGGNGPSTAETGHADPGGSVAAGSVQMIRIDQIKQDPSVQPRKQLHEPTVQSYARAMREGAQFPPIVVFRQADVDILGDGLHRVSAAEEAGIDQLPAVIYEGDTRQAFLHALAANGHAGRPLTKAEKQAAVLRMLDDAEWSQWADTVIAQRCGVSSQTVGRCRKKTSKGQSSERQYERDGKTIRANTANLGRRTKGTASPTPPAPAGQERPDPLPEQTDAEDTAVPFADDTAATEILDELRDILERAGDAELIHSVVVSSGGIGKATRIADELRELAVQWDAAVCAAGDVTPAETAA